jgi:predicted acyltransferase (DUF342 family)
MMVLGIGMLMSFLRFQDLKHENENQKAKAVGEQIKKIGDAVNGYINIHYDKLSTLTASKSQTADPGPRTCSGDSCTITTQTLVNEGLLPQNFTGKNALNSGYNIKLNRDGTSPNYLINGLITTAQPWTEAGKVRYDLLGKAMQEAGVDSGMTKSQSKVAGYSGSWSESTEDYSNINKAGLLSYRVGYNSAMYSVYLRRDGTLPMTGNLNMGGQSISNTKDITASGKVKSGSVSTGNVDATGYLKITGATTLSGALVANKGATVKNGFTVESGTTVIKGALAANKGATVNNGFTVASGTTVIKGATQLGNTLTVSGASNLKGKVTVNSDLQVNKAIVASGNITSSGTITAKTFHSTSNMQADGAITSSSDITANKRLTTNEYLKINGVGTAGAACSSSGLQSRSSTGQILSCVNGKWTNPASTLTNYYITAGGRCDETNSLTSACSCPSGQEAIKFSQYDYKVTVGHGHGDDLYATRSRVVYVCK